MISNIYDASGFDWDEENSDKNWYSHDVTNGECEEIFFNFPLVVAHDEKHSAKEIRYYALGRTDADRWLFVAFTLRNSLIRVISARDMNQREGKKYANHTKGYSRFRS